MRRWIPITFLITLLSLSQTALGQVSNTIIRSSESGQPIEICGITVTTQIYARLMTSVTEICLRNPNNRILEGSLSLPLRDGQTVTGFKLGATEPGRGSMTAVPVPKAKATKVFEAIERKTADPGLLERAEGNIYSLRVYPLLPNRDRAVYIETVEALIPDAKGQNHLNPAAVFAGIKGAKGTSLIVEGEAIGIPSGALRFKGFKATPGATGSTRFIATVPLDKPIKDLRVDWTAPGGDSILLGQSEGESYFYADLPVPAAAAVRPKPEHVALIWDASGSGAARDHAAEFALLDGYFKMLGKAEVALVVARDQAEPSRPFTITNGEWSDLRRALETVAYDGASNQAAWAVPKGFGGKDAVALLMSDGLANWGKGTSEPSFVPLFAINSTLGGDANRLRHLAEASKGKYLDLTRLSPQQVLAELTSVGPRIAGLSAEGADQLVSASAYPESGRVVLAGHLTGKEAATLTLDLIDGAGKTGSRRIVLHSGDTSPFAAKRWAELKIAALEGDGPRNRTEILHLGERYGIVSSETSLLALEQLDDFLRYDVLPPEGGMRRKFLELQPRTKAMEVDNAHIDSLVQRYNDLTEWWKRGFPKDEKPKPKPEPKSMDAAVRATGTAVPMPAPVMSSSGPSTPASTANTTDAQIHLRKWEPNAPYMSPLKEAAPDQRYAVYLEQRKAYAASTAFLIDAADIFFEAGQADLGVRILSNIAEVGWHNRSLLRILSYRLQQAGQVVAALPLLERVRDLAPEEPQSWRDLGLAHAAAGNIQQAIDDLWQTASRRWDSRFADIDLISLEELNALAARYRTGNLSAIDPRLIRVLPVDLRVVLTWDADNSDMDLWVVDPNGEKAYYGNRLTYQGGHMSRDFTAGLGPEEFLLKTAKPGQYKVFANFYGHRQQVLSPYTTLMLRLSTKFGTANQKDQDIVLRLSGHGETVEVGTFEVSDKGALQ